MLEKKLRCGVILPSSPQKTILHYETVFRRQGITHIWACIAYHNASLLEFRNSVVGPVLTYGTDTTHKTFIKMQQPIVTQLRSHCTAYNSGVDALPSQKYDRKIES